MAGSTRASALATGDKGVSPYRFGRFLLNALLCVSHCAGFIADVQRTQDRRKLPVHLRLFVFGNELQRLLPLLLHFQQVGLAKFFGPVRSPLACSSWRRVCSRLAVSVSLARIFLKYNRKPGKSQPAGTLTTRTKVGILIVTGGKNERRGAMRSWTGRVVVLLCWGSVLGGCRPQPSVTERPGPALIPKAVSEPAGEETAPCEPPATSREIIAALEQDLQALQQHLAQGKIEAARQTLQDLRPNLAKLPDALPGKQLRQQLEETRKDLEQHAFRAAQESLDEAQKFLEEAETYGLSAAEVELFLAAARTYAGKEQPSAALIELEKAQALLRLTPVEAPQRDFQAALQELAQGLDRGNTAAARASLETAQGHLRRLALATSLMDVKHHLGRARQQLALLATAETQKALREALNRLQEAAQEQPALALRMKELQKDFEGLERDLAENDPGTPDRLTALWKKVDGLVEPRPGGEETPTTAPGKQEPSHAHVQQQTPTAPPDRAGPE